MTFPDEMPWLLPPFSEAQQGMKCQWPGCQEDATHLAAACQSRYKPIPKDVPQAGYFCYAHAHKVANDGAPEYHDECPNCGCIHGVN